MSDPNDAWQENTPPATLGPRVGLLLQRTQPWVRLLAILGFISVALMALVGVGGGILGVTTQSTEMIGLLVVYPLIGLLYLFPAIYLYRYANRIGDFIKHRTEAHLEQALEAQRAFWKFVGILMLVSMILAVVFVGLAIAGGIFMATNRG